MQRIPANDAFFGFPVPRGKIKFQLHISLFYCRRTAEISGRTDALLIYNPANPVQKVNEAVCPVRLHWVVRVAISFLSHNLSKTSRAFRKPLLYFQLLCSYEAAFRMQKAVSRRILNQWIWAVSLSLESLLLFCTRPILWNAGDGHKLILHSQRWSSFSPFWKCRASSQPNANDEQCRLLSKNSKKRVFVKVNLSQGGSILG